MTTQNKNLVLILLAIAMFTGMAIEINEGSIPVGIFLFITSLLLLSRVDFKDFGDLKFSKVSKIHLLLGIFIVVADIYYNFKKGGGYGTLDIMTIFFGLSLIGIQLPNLNISRIAKFGMYFSSVFIILYLIFYTLFDALHIDLLQKFAHYFLLLPTVWILNLAGLPLKAVSTETVQIGGVEEMTLSVGNPCTGLYSMFLLIGIIFAYSRIEKMDNKKTVKLLGFSIIIAHVSNMFRIVVLYLTAYYYGHEVMMTVHTHLGWILFAGMAGLIIYLANRKKT